MSLRMSEEEYAALMARRQTDEIAAAMARRAEEKPRRQKYGNRRVEIDGMKFDSRHEADYYFGVLVPRMKAGELKCALRQVSFDLPGGIKYMPIS